jgi:glycosyltransferase involved in cell wall biosynthesis
LINRELPNATLIIAGDPPERIPSYGSGIRGVSFTGFVKDLNSLYGQSRVVCAPILSGGGTRVKILEAAAYGKPIVATCIGVEGIQMQDGKEIFLRDDPKSFAEACIHLLNDHALCDRVGMAARSAATRKYDQSKIKLMIQEIIKESY